MKTNQISTVLFTALLLLGHANYLKANHNDTLKGSEEATAISHIDPAAAARAAKMRTALIGRWENPFFSVENELDHPALRAGSLKYHFRADGTYSKILGGAETIIEEKGPWEVSEDSKYLLMRSRSLCNGQEVATTQVATIKHLQFDEMVLEQAICVDGVTISAEPQNFYFNKY